MKNKLANYLLIAIWTVMTVGLITALSFTIPTGNAAWNTVFAIISVICYAVMTVAAYEAVDNLRIIYRRQRRAKRNGRKLSRCIDRAKEVAKRRIKND